MPRGQLVQFPFRSGQTEDVDPKQSPPGTLVKLENVRQLRTGEIVKRNGFVSLTSAVRENVTDLAAGALSSLRSSFALAQYEKELLAFSNERMLVLTPNAWVDRGMANRFQAAKTVIRGVTGGSLLERGICFSTDKKTLWVAFVVSSNGSSGQAFIQCYESSTLTLIRETRTFVSDATKIKLIAVGDRILLLMSRAGAAVVRCYETSQLDPTGTGTEYTLPGTTGMVVGGNIDAVSQLSNQFTLFYARTSAPFMGVSLYQFNSPSPTPPLAFAFNFENTLGPGASSAIAACISGSQIFLSWTVNATSSGYVAAILNASSLAVNVATFTISSAPQVAQIGMCASGTGVLVVSSGLPAFNGYVECFQISSGGTLTPLGRSISATMASKPFVGSDSQAFAMLRTIGNSFGIARLNYSSSANRPMNFVAFCTPKTTLGPNAIGGHNPFDMLFDGRNYITLGDQIVSSTATVLTLLSFDSKSQPSACTGNFLATYSCGHVQQYDGVMTSDAAFPDAPQLSVAAISGGSGSRPAAGVFTYQVCLEWTDNLGNRVRSEPSLPVAVTLSIVERASLTITIPLGWQFHGPYNRTTPVEVVVYRTRINSSSIFYRVTPSLVPTAQLVDAELNSVNNVKSIIVVNDPPATGGEFGALYTTGGVLPSQCPPGLRSLTLHASRLVGIGDDPDTVWLSTEFVNNERPRWNVELTIQFPASLVGLASIDDKLIAFGANGIWAVTGEGKNELGLGSWSTPQPVHSVFGCSSAASIVKLPTGIGFLSQRGFCMLSRGLEVVEIGRAVKDVIAAYPEVLCATLVERESLVIWECAKSNGETVAIVFDYSQSTWSVDYRRVNGTTSRALAACAYEGRYHVAETTSAPSCAVFAQQSGVYTDSGYWIPSAVETAWIAAQGPHATQRTRKVKLLAEQMSSHEVEMKLAFDYDPTWRQSFRFDDVLVSEMATGVEMRVGVANGANPRNTAIAIRLQDYAPSANVGTGQGARWSGLVVEMVPRSGTQRVNSGSKV